jgi:hypothetical protein
MMQCGDGFERADNSSLGRTRAKTANYTILQNEDRHAYTNAGAAGAVTFTLPAPKDGDLLHFIKVVPAQNLLIQATNGAKINNGTADKIYQNVTSETGTCTLTSDGTNWFVLCQFGTWANNNA